MVCVDFYQFLKFFKTQVYRKFDTNCLYLWKTKQNMKCIRLFITRLFCRLCLQCFEVHFQSLLDLGLCDCIHEQIDIL